MNKQIFIINGSGRVGKDTFVKFITIEMAQITKKIRSVENVSSVDEIKNIARMLGWKGGKSEKDRRFLSDLKVLTSKYNGFPFKSIKSKVEEFRQDDTTNILFLHIREPEEIQRAVDEFGAKTILIKRDNVKHITSNMADKNVFNYEYDYVIENNGTKEEFKEKAREFFTGVCQ